MVPVSAPAKILGLDYCLPAGGTMNPAEAEESWDVTGHVSLTDRKCMHPVAWMASIILGCPVLHWKRLSLITTILGLISSAGC